MTPIAPISDASGSQATLRIIEVTAALDWSDFTE
jgi:hypothetical protein